MNKFILGQKDRMTQIFNEEGKVVPTTVINISKNIITQVKTEQTDGYNSVQVATLEKKEKNISKSLKKHLGGAYRFVKEFRLKETPEYKKGDELTIEGFELGDKVTITSISKGKGFQGGVKRHNFSGGRRSHGNKHAEREVGSIGAGTTPGRVWKGKKMPGRTGSDKITVKNLKIVKIDNENNRIFIKGAVAGKAGDLVEIVK